jgi:hypothetical protein
MVQESEIHISLDPVESPRGVPSPELVHLLCNGASNGTIESSLVPQDVVILCQLPFTQLIRLRAVVNEGGICGCLIITETSPSEYCLRYAGHKSPAQLVERGLLTAVQHLLQNETRSSHRKIVTDCRYLASCLNTIFKPQAGPVLSTARQSMECWSGLPDVTRIRLPGHPNRYHICHAQVIRMQDLADYDRQVTGLRRSKWLRLVRDHSNTLQPGSISLVITYAMEPDISGYGFIRPGAEGLANLGPLYANSDSHARMLFRALLGSFSQARFNGVRLSIPSDNKNMRLLLEEAGLSVECVRPLFSTGDDAQGVPTNSKIHCLSNTPAYLV